ncbi:polysaccharide deacetylase family protein [Azoarcus sp. PA01]|nr:polysaccharide deacetylase family protein [Azoarcus sp. PA01]
MLSDLGGVRAAVCVSLHDVAPATWSRCERLLAALAKVAAVPHTLLVVPDYHRRGDGEPPWYRAALAAQLEAGDELALHGLFHLDDAPAPSSVRDWLRRRVLTCGEGEFAALARYEAAARLRAGEAWFRDAGWPLYGFIAPAWLLGAGAWQALDDSAFAYTTSLGHFHLLHPRRALAAPCVVYSTRSRWRLGLSLARNARLTHHDPVLARLALHPDDALHPTVVHQAQRLLEKLLQQRVAMTKIGFANTLRAALGAGAPHSGGMTTSDSAATAPPTATPASTSLG